MAANDRKRAMRNGQYWVFKTSEFISLCWVNNCYLCDWSLKLGGGRSQFHISHSAIPSWVHVDHSGYGPFSTNSIGIMRNYDVIHSDIASLHFPLLSWNQQRKHVSGPASSKAIYYSLHTFCSDGANCWFLGTVLVVLLTKIDRGTCRWGTSRTHYWGHWEFGH